jgi:hypothetical protein
MEPFPDQSHTRWRRLDLPGREEARIEQTANRWRLTGRLEVEEAGLRAELMWMVSGFDTHEFGRVLLYEGLWEAEIASLAQS